MAKKIAKIYQQEDSPSILEEAAVRYITSSRVMPTLENFSYKHFYKIVQKGPFSLAQWAELLYISERTLQRYAKANSTFSGLLVERILHLEKLINLGNDTFNGHFAEWLSSPSFQLNGSTPFQQLFSYVGIEKVIDMVGRIQHGIVA
jgi:putative toxin-antitoxin system antitoxin component (TIGR02293 family)